MAIFKIDSRASFTDAHMIKALMMLETAAGREALMKTLGLNEASARTLLRNLEGVGYVKPSAKGHVLTTKGQNFLSFIKLNIMGPVPVDMHEISVSKYNIAYLVRKKASKIKLGIEQRDQAIKFGADGLTTIICNKELFIPGMTGFKVSESIVNAFPVSSGDVILVGSAKNEITADLAALNSALLLME